jgi:hypothetical protein
MRQSQRLWNRKGQLTLFILLGLIVLLVFASFFALMPKSRIPLDFTAPSIQSYLDNCLTQTAEEGLGLLGKQGGRIQLQEYVSAPHHGISFWLKEGALTAPSKEEMENQLVLYINNNLGRCINGFEAFEDRGWQVEASSFSTTTSINRQDVSFAVSYPISITQEESSLSISELRATLQVRLGYVHDAAREATLFMQKNGKMDLTALDASTLNITIFPYKDALIYQFADQNSILQNKPFVFNLAIS